MTTRIYILTDQPMPHTAFLQAMVSPHYEVSSVETTEALREALLDGSDAVVLFGSSLGKETFRTAQIREISSTCTCVAVMDRELVAADSVPSGEYTYLLMPCAALDVLNVVATASRMSELKSMIEASSQRDEVTLLYNRRYFFHRVNAEISLSKRHLSPLTCVVIGMNFLQVYMDSYGYDFVLELLRDVAGKIREQVRQEDIIARIGDSEIGLLLPRSTEKGAKNLTDRIIRNLEETPFVLEGVTPPGGEELSVHAGIAGFPLPDEQDMDADSLIRYARHALHQARCSDTYRVQLFSEIQPIF